MRAKGVSCLSLYWRMRRYCPSKDFLTGLGARSFICICFVALLTPQKTFGQSSDTTILRDPKAIEVLSKGLEAMGGHAGWKDVRSVRIKGDVSVNGGPPGKLNWSDDWSNGLKAKRELIPSADVMQSNRSSASSSSASDATDANHLFHPKFDIFSSLLVHAPAAAIELAYSSEQYSVVSAESGLDDENCVEILLATKRLKDGGVHSQLCFSKATNLVTNAQVAVPTGAEGNRIVIEKITYGSFEKRSGLAFPTKVSMTLPGLTEHYVFREENRAPSIQDAGSGR